jgi:Tfp pilus assembly protein PilO
MKAKEAETLSVKLVLVVLGILLAIGLGYKLYVSNSAFSEWDMESERSDHLNKELRRR